MKDTNFYNAESEQYSAKRYPREANSYVQFFFKERLARALKLMVPIVKGKKVSTLEIGSADGVTARAVWEQFPETHERFDAIDISPEMIRVAKERRGDIGVQFSVRGAELSGTYDFIFELGVLNYLGIDAEMPAVAHALSPNGRYVCSISGSSALIHRLKGADAYQNLRSYKEYEALFEKYFVIERTDVVGFFVPFLWKFPAIGRLKQPIVEWLGRVLAPSLAHEKLYVLKKR